MTLLVDATALIALGTVGELNHLTVFDRQLVVPPAVEAEVTTEPARTNCARFLDSEDIAQTVPDDESRRDALTLLGDDEVSADVHLVALLLEQRATDRPVALVSDDRRLRTVARALDVDVTGTIGVVVRAVAAGLDPATAKDLVHRLDAHGLHMTGELRERAEELIDAAAE